MNASTVVSSKEEYWEKVKQMSDQVDPAYIESIEGMSIRKVISDIGRGMREEFFPMMAALICATEPDSGKRHFLHFLGGLMFLSDPKVDRHNWNKALTLVFENLACNAPRCSVDFPSLLAWGMRWHAMAEAARHWV